MKALLIKPTKIDGKAHKAGTLLELTMQAFNKLFAKGHVVDITPAQWSHFTVNTEAKQAFIDKVTKPKTEK